MPRYAGRGRVYKFRRCPVVIARRSENPMTRAYQIVGIGALMLGLFLLVSGPVMTMKAKGTTHTTTEKKLLDDKTFVKRILSYLHCCF
jgi:hypothetical protein